MRITDINNYIRLKRDGSLPEDKELELINYYSSKMAPITRMFSSKAGYGIEELYTSYWEGIYKAFVGKKRDGSYYVDLNHPEFYTMIYSMGYWACKDFFKKWKINKAYELKKGFAISENYVDKKMLELYFITSKIRSRLPNNKLRTCGYILDSLNDRGMVVNDFFLKEVGIRYGIDRKKVSKDFKFIREIIGEYV